MENTQCREPSQLRPLPTQVLKLTGSKKVRLHITDPEGRHKYRYTCLIHCWGDVAAMRTTTVSLGQYCDSIPWSSLPQTFKSPVGNDGLGEITAGYMGLRALCLEVDTVDLYDGQSKNDLKHHSSCQSGRKRRVGEAIIPHHKGLEMMQHYPTRDYLPGVATSFRQAQIQDNRPDASGCECRFRPFLAHGEFRDGGSGRRSLDLSRPGASEKSLGIFL